MEAPSANLNEWLEFRASTYSGVCHFFSGDAVLAHLQEDSFFLSPPYSPQSAGFRADGVWHWAQLWGAPVSVPKEAETGRNRRERQPPRSQIHSQLLSFMKSGNGSCSLVLFLKGVSGFFSGLVTNGWV